MYKNKMLELRMEKTVEPGRGPFYGRGFGGFFFFLALPEARVRTHATAVIKPLRPPENPCGIFF